MARKLLLFYFLTVDRKVDKTNQITFIMDWLKEAVTKAWISRLKKYGWLKLELDPEDSRKRLYKLKDPADAVKEMSNG